MRRVTYLALSLAALLSAATGCKEDVSPGDAPTESVSAENVSEKSVSTESVSTQGASRDSVSTESTSTDGVSAEELLKKLEAAYKALETYKADGTVVADIDMEEMKTKIETSFSILLKKPNLYLISWVQKMPMMPMTQEGTVWSDGTQPYLYMSATNAYSKMESDEVALGAATGVSSGAAATIPSLFLPEVFGQHVYSLSSRLNDPVIERTERFEGQDCYVVAGSSVFSKKETFWISKEGHLIRKYERSLEPPEGGMQMPEMSDEDIEDTLRNLGQEVTEESKKNMREMMDRSRQVLLERKIKGTFTEVYREVSSPELSQGDFEYTPPPSAVLKKSLFEGVFSGTRPQCTPPGGAAFPKESLFDGSRTRPGG